TNRPLPRDGPTTHRESHMREGPHSGSHHGTRLVLAAVTAMAALTAACGSSTSNPSNGGGSSSASAGNDAAVVQKAQAFMQPYLTPPTRIPLTEPLKAAPAK